MWSCLFLDVLFKFHVTTAPPVVAVAKTLSTDNKKKNNTKQKKKNIPRGFCKRSVIISTDIYKSYSFVNHTDRQSSNEIRALKKI